ncbi:MAG: Asp-tRNA(Asn)/Glu-tRNA(Gln) amidotransferase GatCAB subunit C [Bacilli bacterium]|nr:Asp-tRNA(Asn)/Glu-tRNA(Gln) amidotransferase GatCAB subunit C [Bacilli bacterium]
MITKDKLELYAKKLMFEMNEEEYKTLESEFEVILKQMELIDNIKEIEKVSPMTFPFDLELDDRILREDIYSNEINFDDMKINVKEYEEDMVKVPKVVE